MAASRALVAALFICTHISGLTTARDVARTRQQLKSLLANADVTASLALLRAQHPDTRSTIAEWVSDSAVIEAEMGISKLAPTVCPPTHTQRRRRSSHNGTACTPIEEMPLRMVHFMRATLRDGRTVPVYTTGRGHELPHVGSRVPIAGFIDNGTLFTDVQPYECLPLLRNHQPRRHRLNCSLAGSWRLYSSETDVAAAVVQQGVHARPSSSSRGGARGLQLAQLPLASSPKLTRTVLAVRVQWEGGWEQVSDDSYDSMLNYLATMHGSRSFGRIAYNITRNRCMVTIPLSFTTIGIRSAVLSAMAAAGGACMLEVSAYDHFIMFLPESPFSWGGVGSINGQSVWINGQGATSAATLAHEIGHNFGLYHASTWAPSSRRVSEYGDRTDVMGRSLDMITGDYGAGFKHAMGWISNSLVISVDASTPSARFLLAAMDRDNAILTPPHVLPNNTFLTARVPIAPRGAYMSTSQPAFLYLSYRSQHAVGRNGVFLNEVPIDPGLSMAGRSFLVCVSDPNCGGQDPVYSGGAYVYDVSGAPLLVQVGNKVRVLPGSADTTDADSALAVRLSLLGADGLPLDPEDVLGCDARGCTPPVPQVSTLQCGVMQLMLSAEVPVAIYMMDPSVNGTITVTTCPADGSPPTVPTVMSFYVGAFPLVPAYYASGSVGSAGDLFSSTTYAANGSSSRACGTIVFTAYPSISEWLLVSASSDSRNRSVAIELRTSCTTAVPPRSYFPDIRHDGLCYSGLYETYSVVPGASSGGLPVWQSGDNNFFYYDGQCSHQWVVSARIGACPTMYTFCTVAGRDYTTIDPPLGICTAGSYSNAGVCTPCPPGMLAAPGSTSVGACACTRGWTWNSTLGACSGVSIGGPAATRTVSSAVDPRQPAPAPLTTSGFMCAQHSVPNASGVCIPCAAGSINVYGANTCVYQLFQTIVLNDVPPFARGVWKLLDASITYRGMRVYQQATQASSPVASLYLLHTGRQWAVVRSIGDEAVLAFVPTPSSTHPPQYASSTSFAICDAVDAAAFDDRGLRMCTCPSGSSPNEVGVCSPCAPGRASTPAYGGGDQCVPCPVLATPAGSMLSPSACNATLCPSIKVEVATRCDTSDWTCNSLDPSGVYSALPDVDLAESDGQLVFVRSSPPAYLYYWAARKYWVIDRMLRGYSQYGMATIMWYGVSSVQIGLSGTWASVAYWNYAVTTAFSCVQCRQGYFGTPAPDGTGCTACSAGRTTAPLSAPTLNSSACVCDVGFGGASCAQCNSSFYKDVIGNSECMPCPKGLVSSDSAGRACACPAGYRNDSTGACVDVDECALLPSPCGSAGCTNMMGSYVCGCSAGFAVGLDGRSCSRCGAYYVGNGTMCLPCARFMQADAAGLRCICPAPYIGSDDGSCTPPAVLQLTSQSAPNATLQLQRLQYVTVAAPAAAGIPSRVLVASPVYASIGCSNTTFTGSMWLYWSWRAPWGVGSAGGTRWALDALPNIVSAAAPVAAQLTSYGNVLHKQAYPPVMQGAWSMFQRGVLNTFALDTGTTLSVPSFSGTAQACINMNVNDTAAGGSSLSVSIGGLVAASDLLLFVPVQVGCTSVSPTQAYNASMMTLDSSLAANLTVPSAPGTWLLCIIAANFGSSSVARPVMTSKCAKEMCVTVKEVAGPSATSTPTGSASSSNRATSTSAATGASMSSSVTESGLATQTAAASTASVSVAAPPSSSVSSTSAASSTASVSVAAPPSSSVSSTSAASSTASVSVAAPPSASGDFVASKSSTASVTGANGSASTVPTFTQTPSGSVTTAASASSSATLSTAIPSAAVANASASVSQARSAAPTVSGASPPSGTSPAPSAISSNGNVTYSSSSTASTSIVPSSSASSSAMPSSPSSSSRTALPSASATSASSITHPGSRTAAHSLPPALPSMSASISRGMSPSGTSTPLLPSFSAAPAVDPAKSDFYQLVTFAFVIAGARPSELLSPAVLRGILESFAAALNVPVRFIIVVGYTDRSSSSTSSSSSMLRMLQQDADAASVLQLGVRTTPDTPPAASIAASVANLPVATLQNVTAVTANALAVATGRSASSFTVALDTTTVTVAAAATSASATPLSADGLGSSGGLPVSAIAGIAVGAVAGGMLVLLVVLLLLRVRTPHVRLSRGLPRSRTVLRVPITPTVVPVHAAADTQASFRQPAGGGYASPRDGTDA